MLNKKTLVIAISSLLIGIIGTSIVWVYAQSSPNTMYLSGGVYPSASSFTIWREGSFYFAKNSYGQIPSWGENTNVTAISETAIDTINANGGGELIYLAGEYNPTQCILLKSNVHVRGEQRDAVVFKVADATPDNWGIYHSIFRYHTTPHTTGSNIHVSDLTLDNNNLGNSYPFGGSGFLSPTINSKFTNVKVLGFNGTNQAGLSFNNVTYGDISENLIVNGGNGGSLTCEGIYIADTTYSTLTKNQIINMSREGIYVEAGSSHNTFSENIFANIGAEGIDVKKTADYNTISDNQFVNVTNAVYIASDYNTVSGNEFYNITNGIYIYDTVTGDSFGNSISGNSIDLAGNVGIGIAYQSDATISDNTITNTVNEAIRLLSSENITVGLNTLTSNYNGILITTSNFSTFTGNVVRDSTAYGLSEANLGEDYNIITSCSVMGSGTADILVFGANTKVNLCYNGTTWIA